jgi:hypothetical protein
VKARYPIEHLLESDPRYRDALADSHARDLFDTDGLVGRDTADARHLRRLLDGHRQSGRTASPSAAPAPPGPAAAAASSARRRASSGVTSTHRDRDVPVGVSQRYPVQLTPVLLSIPPSPPANAVGLGPDRAHFSARRNTVHRDPRNGNPKQPASTTTRRARQASRQLRNSIPATTRHIHGCRSRPTGRDLAKVGARRGLPGGSRLYSDRYQVTPSSVLGGHLGGPGASFRLYRFREGRTGWLEDVKRCVD